MTWKHALAGALLATTALASAPASATIIRGYTDLYVTTMEYSTKIYEVFYEHPNDIGRLDQETVYAPCRFVASGPCAKTRFSFEYDTTKPPHETRTSLLLLNTYYIEDSDPGPSTPPGFPTAHVNGKEYLPLAFDPGYGVRESYTQLGPIYAPDDMTAPPTNLPADRIINGYELTRFAVGRPGNAFDLAFAANRWATWAEGDLCDSEDYESRNCRNLAGQKPGQAGAIGPFFRSGYSNSTLQDFAISNLGESFFRWTSNRLFWSATPPDVRRVGLVDYAFDNDPANWIDGPPEARVWAVAAPEPASLSLLGVGLLALLLAKRRLK